MDNKLTLHYIKDFGWEYQKRFVGLPEFSFFGKNMGDYMGEYELVYDIKSHRLTIEGVHQGDGYYFIGTIKTKEDFDFLMRVMDLNITRQAILDNSQSRNYTLNDFPGKGQTTFEIILDKDWF